MLKHAAKKVGDILITVYDFEFKNDILEPHKHEETDIHFTVIARGSFEITDGNKKRPSKSGEVIIFKPGLTHSFKALEDNSRIVNIPYNITLGNNE